jgi:hypothetical protein
MNTSKPTNKLARHSSSTNLFDPRWQQYSTHMVDTRWQQYSTHFHNSTQNTENGTYIKNWDLRAVPRLSKEACLYLSLCDLYKNMRVLECQRVLLLRATDGAGGTACVDFTCNRFRWWRLFFSKKACFYLSRVWHVCNKYIKTCSDRNGKLCQNLKSIGEEVSEI